MSPDAATPRIPPTPTPTPTATPTQMPSATPPAVVPAWPRYAFPAFALFGALNLAFEAAGPRLGFDLTKPLLMPLLAMAMLARARATPRLLLGALLGSALGDTMLLFSGTWFLVGMAGFATAHVCYIRLFVRGGALRNRSRLALAVLGYGAVWAVLISRLWPDLDPSLRIPVACYSLLLASMATCSYAASRRTGLGGALFLLSDSMIAGGLAHWHMPSGTGFAIMATYLVGQYLLATGSMTVDARALRRRAGR